MNTKVKVRLLQHIHKKYIVMMIKKTAQIFVLANIAISSHILSYTFVVCKVETSYK